MLMGAMGLSAIAAAAEVGINEYATIPKASRDHSKPATLTQKAWKKLKRRLQITKASRKANR